MTVPICFKSTLYPKGKACKLHLDTEGRNRGLGVWHIDGCPLTEGLLATFQSPPNDPDIDKKKKKKNIEQSLPAE